MGRRDDAHVASYGATPSATLVGRDRELAKIRERFDEGALLTVVGAAGMGKTHVALAYAADLASSYEAAGGAWFVDLTNVRSLEAFVAAVAFALGAPIGDGSPDDRAAWVGERLSRDATVLVLDNFEQLASDCAELVERWARQASPSKVLVTSRAILGVPSERVLSLGPLPLEAATELFLRRMRDLDTWDEHADRAVAERIVESVDRMPLAIELAASRTSVLALDELEARLAHRLDVLRAPAGREERHGSVERAVRDSVELLTESERRVFGLLSVFADGARMADIEAVFGDLALTDLPPLDVLERLGRVSLLRCDRSGPVARHSFFRTIREVAESLAATEALLPEARAGHATHYAALASKEGLGRSPIHDGDLANLFRAHAHALATNRVTEACQLALALESPLAARGRTRDALNAFDATVGATAGSHVSPEVVAGVHLGRGRALQDIGQTADARADADVALAVSEGHPLRRAEALLQLGALEDVAGDTEAARDRYQEALVFAKQASERDLMVVEEV